MKNEIHCNWRGYYKVGKESLFSRVMQTMLHRLLRGRYDIWRK